MSVIVTVVEGGLALTRCLEALSRQSNPPTMETIVPYDDTVSAVKSLVGDFTHVRFLPLGRIVACRAPRNAFMEHKLYDRRRAAGLRASRGSLVAILEDRGVPAVDWARTMAQLHGVRREAAIGGAIENRASGLLQWAVFFCDFGRYLPPLHVSDPTYVSDINICYKRSALEDVRHLWQDRYQEVSVNWELQRKGLGLYLSDEARIFHYRGNMSLLRMMRERLHWGRTFAQARGSEAPRWKCLLWAAGSPGLPALLYIRHLYSQLRKRRFFGQFLLATPAMALLLPCWAAGEFAGYVRSAARRTGRLTKKSRPPRGNP